MSLWPHPTLAEKFEELEGQSRAVEAQLKAINQAMSKLQYSYRRLEQNVADTVRTAIMQRENAEAALSALEKVNIGSHQPKEQS